MSLTGSRLRAAAINSLSCGRNSFAPNSPTSTYSRSTEKPQTAKPNADSEGKKGIPGGEPEHLRNSSIALTARLRRCLNEIAAPRQLNRNALEERHARE